MRLAREDLELTPRLIEADHFEILESDEGVLGYIHLRLDGGPAELVDIFVEAGHIGRGHGARLFRRALDVGRAAGAMHLELDADPNAEAFYVAQGMERIGASPSPLDATRLLPRMRISLS